MMLDSAKSKYTNGGLEGYRYATQQTGADLRDSPYRSER
jgi:hypothetical protein